MEPLTAEACALCGSPCDQAKEDLVTLARHSSANASPAFWLWVVTKSEILRLLTNKEDVCASGDANLHARPHCPFAGVLRKVW